MTWPVFLLAIHCHQPGGNFPSIFDHAFKTCYLPLFETLRAHPRIKFTAHFSGPLLEYFWNRAPSFLELLQHLSQRGQMEVLGGGFYEPILPLIPEEDRQAQLRLMTDFLATHLDCRPRGVWLAERVWEPQLAKTLALAGAEYTLLDEEHFRLAADDLHGYFITEDESYPLRLFPIDKKLRYLVPFHPPAEFLAYLRSIGGEGRAAILGDDGEKFGLWPGTREAVFEQGWLESFLRMLEDQSISTMTFSEYLDGHRPIKKIYLPPASYEEMTEWVLEPEDQAQFLELKKKIPLASRKFLRGGFFRHFFTRYPEADHLHQRMLLVSRSLRNLKEESPEVREARLNLYRGQGNDAYWHGVFGGLYFPHLRQAVYHHLLLAEKALPASSAWEVLDFNADARPELIYRGERWNWIVNPSRGGSLVEIDHRGQARCLTDVLTRRPEFYHRQRTLGAEGASIHELKKELPKEAEKYLIYDRYPLHSLLDHLFAPEAQPENFFSGEIEELLSLPTTEYAFRLEGEKLILAADINLKNIKQLSIGLRLEKIIRPTPSGMQVEIFLHNENRTPFQALFASEWNLSLRPEEFEVSEGSLILSGGRISLRSRPEALIIFNPIHTVSQSEKGFDIIHQGFRFLFLWKAVIPGRGEFRLELELQEHET